MNNSIIITLDFPEELYNSKLESEEVNYEISDENFDLAEKLEILKNKIYKNITQLKKDVISTINNKELILTGNKDLISIKDDKNTNVLLDLKREKGKVSIKMIGI